MTDGTLHMATFNAERFWRDSTMANLPSFKDKQADIIVEMMDETQFLFTKNPQDVVCTRYPMNVTHKNYLDGLGFKFISNELPVNFDDDVLPELSKNVAELLYQQPDNLYFDQLFSESSTFSPYAVLPGTKELCMKYRLGTKLPELHTIAKVNSKLFSAKLAQSKSLGAGSIITHTAAELKQTAFEMLKKGPCLVKDAFGVSGKGNMLIEREHTLNHIYKYLLKQENEGKTAEFVIEPLLNRKSDFSCQFIIHPDGSYELIAVQEMLNNKFSFSGMRKISLSFYQELDRGNYFDTVAVVATSLYKEGYFGPVCLDSMVLVNNTIIPIIEINARKSMGFLSYELNEFLKPFKVTCDLVTYAFGTYEPLSFEALYTHLKQNKLLFDLDNQSGILPISANTFDINSRLFKTGRMEGLIKGRWYAGLIYKNEAERLGLETRVQSLFKTLNLKML